MTNSFAVTHLTNSLVAAKQEALRLISLEKEMTPKSVTLAFMGGHPETLPLPIYKQMIIIDCLTSALNHINLHNRGELGNDQRSERPVRPEQQEEENPELPPDAA